MSVDYQVRDVADWHDIPAGYYAVPIADYAGEPLGFNLFQRKEPRTYKTGRTVGRDEWMYGAMIRGLHHYNLPGDGVERDRLNRMARATFDHQDYIEYVLANLDRCRADFGRLTGHCGSCGRALTVPDSKMRGIGPECIKYVGFREFESYE